MIVRTNLNQESIIRNRFFIKKFDPELDYLFLAINAGDIFSVALCSFTESAI